MTEVSGLYSSIIEKKDALLEAQEAFHSQRSEVIRNTRSLQHQITGLWVLATVVGGYYVWTNWTPLEEGQSPFGALASRNWAPLEVGASAGYCLLSLAMQSSETVATARYGKPPEEEEQEQLQQYQTELATEISKYLTSGVQSKEQVPVDRVQHMLALNLEAIDVVALLQAAFKQLATERVE